MPGATFGGLLDLRPQPGPPVGPQAAGPGPGLPAAPAAGQLLCHQLVILLETEEVISPAHRTRSRGTTGGVIRKLHGEHQEMTTGLSMTHFLFSVPLLATPSFRTPMVSLR
ncbi:DUF3656 domain-containing protein [Haematococcus lacustris]|uniref:DUF3656 domain-containing protein n=1 Tax=Haematococcus lacustris TaxID=44745 RepID=A0A699YHV8_HAELA|nr:DUF3656 domain-containing protein [Haematococcus lacustris]